MEVVPRDPDHGGQLTLACARADEGASSTLTHEQLQRADDQRLTGSGLARDNVQPRPELDVKFRDDGEVSYVERFEHDCLRETCNKTAAGTELTRHPPGRA